MATTITSLGSYSKRIDVSDETRVTPIISAFDTALTAMGWSVHDTVVSGSRNCMTTKVYSAVNDDDSTSPTTKYVILRFDAPKGFIYMTCAEYWDASTHVVTNESYDFERAFPMTLQTSNMSYYIFASARYMMIHPVFLGESGIWQGVFEWQRNPAIEQDTAATGAPCFGYTNGIIFGEAHSAMNTSGTTTHQNYTQNIIPPRTLDGYTGYGASKTYAINTAFGGIPANTFSLAEGSTSTSISPYGVGKIGTILTILDSSKKIVINPSLTSKYDKYIDTGKIYGLTLTQPIGNSLDTTNIKIDANGFYSDTGADATHYVMNLSGGSSNGISQLNGSLKIKDTLPVSTQSSHLVNGVVVRGRFLYAISLSGTKLHKIDITTGSETVLYFSDTVNSYYHHDIIFDGEDHIYISRSYNSSNSFVVRINVNNDTMDYYPNLTSMGAGQLALDDDRLYVAAARWIMNNNNIRIFNRSESPASATVIANYSNTTSPFSTSHAIGALETNDYGGKLIAFYVMYNSSGSGGHNRFVVLNGSTGIADVVKGYITVSGSNSTSETYYSYTGMGSSMYPDLPLIQYTPQAISVATKGKYNSTYYGWGQIFSITPSGTYDGITYGNGYYSFSSHSTWQNMITNDVGNTSNTNRRRNVFWKGYNLARITNYNSEYTQSYGNYDWIKGVSHGGNAGRVLYSGTHDGRWNSYPQMFNTAFGSYDQMKTYITDGTFLYTLGNSTATNNFIYNNQMSNKNNFGQAMPSILIRK